VAQLWLAKGFVTGTDGDTIVGQVCLSGNDTTSLCDVALFHV